ncbi:MAG TPA: allantoinase AllB [Kofleriaceae bacterium]|jgi:allantoinase
MTDQLRVVRGQRVVHGGAIGPASIHIRRGVIERVADYRDIPHGAHVDEAGDLVVMPGIVDTHVHLNEPGRTEWEGFSTATRAAAIGGITTLVDMPLNSIPPTTSREAFAAKRAAAKGQCTVDVGFWGGVVPGNAGELEGMVADGIRGFKAFMVDSGVEEFGWSDEKTLEPAMGILANTGAPLLVHAELAGPIDEIAGDIAKMDPKAYATYLASRPPSSEEQAIALITRLCRATKARTHIVHHSAASAIAQLRAARAEGLPLTAETCPHYLHFVAEKIPDGATAFKCAPPIRDSANREALWAALAEGVLELVASDHSPCTPALKGLDPTAYGRARSTTQTGLGIDAGVPIARGSAPSVPAMSRTSTTLGVGPGARGDANPFSDDATNPGIGVGANPHAGSGGSSSGGSSSGGSSSGGSAYGGPGGADFMAAWGGVSGLQLALSVVWTEASSRGHSLVDVTRWMCEAPARLARFVGKKGVIAAGADADLIFFDDFATQVVNPANIEHRHKVTPYAGETLRGVVRATYLRGVKIVDDGKHLVTEGGLLL